MHNQPREPQPYEDCQAKSIQEFGWISQWMDWLFYWSYEVFWFVEIVNWWVFVKCELNYWNKLTLPLQEINHHIIIYWDAPVVLGGKTLIGNQRGQTFFRPKCTSWATPLLTWPCVLVHCHAGIPIHDTFSMPWRYMAPSIPIIPFDAVQLSCALCRKTPPKHNVSTSMFDSGDGVLGIIGSIPSPPNTASWVDAKELAFGLIWPFSSESLRNFRRACTCAFLSRGTLRVLQDFSPSRCYYQLFSWWLWSQLPWDHWQDPPSGLIPHRSHDHWNSTRLDLAWSPSPRERYFMFLPFANNCTNCCHFLTKLLGDGLVAHSSLV